MDELEKRGVALLKQYAMLIRLNRPLHAFLGDVADRLGWVEFRKNL